MALQQARQAGEAVRHTAERLEDGAVVIKQAAVKAAPPRAAPGTPAAPPVIPTTWLQPNEQYMVAMGIIGLLETMKLYDILAPWSPIALEPTWSSAYRIQGVSSTLMWLVGEWILFFGLSLLRIPRLSPTLPALTGMLVGWNALCYVLATPGQLFGWINLLGPPALGAHWYSAIWHLLSWGSSTDEGHISGVHKVRILPFSTATLNPLSLTYCIPQGSSAPIYVPVVFNNSAPHQLSYVVRDLDTGKADVQTVSGSSMKRSSAVPLSIADTDDDDVDSPDPLSALINYPSSEVIDYARLPSIKPADSLSIVPTRLADTEQMLFIAVGRPSVVSLKTVSDRRGDKFHIAPHREAVIIECPTGGSFVDENQGQLVPVKSAKKAEQRCVGQEDTLQFQVRGVGAMKAAWRKRSKSGVTTGVIEGIEPVQLALEDGSDDTLGLVRHDRVANTHTVPLRVEHTTPGVYSIAITGVSDSMHNSYSPSGPEWSFDVHARPVVKFDCPKSLLILENRTAELSFRVDSLDGPGHMGDVQLSYEYELADGSIGGDTIKVHGNKGSITAKQPGVYKLVDVSASCSGQIQEPASCRVELIPVPTVKLGTRTLHECAQDVGVTVSFDLTGQPPFAIDYTEQRDGGRAVQRRQIVQSMHGEMVLQPDQEGTYTYKIQSLSDRNYKHLPIDYEPITQTIHPLATVDFAFPRRREQLYACSGDEITLTVETRGRAPLALNYLITSQSYASGKTRSENVTIDIPSGRSSFTVPVPPELAAKTGNKGKFSAALLAITDGNGCTRRLSPAPSYEVDVDRERPTARLAKGDKVVLVEGQQTKAFLRLTGTAPWTVGYTHSGREKSVTMRDPNNALTLSQEGVYRLTKIKDSHCEGEIIDADASYEIAFKPRPRVDVVPSKAFRLQNGVLQHRGLCQEQEDQIAFNFQGQAPFELIYRHTRNGQTSRHTLKSAQSTGVLHLATEPGSHRYDILEVGDQNYGSQPVSSPIAISHEINSRPSVSFAKQHTRKLCLDSALKSDAKIYFKGKAPFHLQLSVRRPASLQVQTYDLVIDKNEWTLDLPKHILKDIGRHEVTISKMGDRTGCEWIVHELDRLSTTVEVVESARIVPVGQATDLCVGDTLEFELQGTAPWSVEYKWLGKSYRVTSSASRFTRYAEKAGDFEVTSVALKDDMCKRDVTGLSRRVHPLPSVQIQDGTDDLREGDDPAVFAVHLKGTAPFSFTYTRSEVVGGKTKVVDTQTISDIWENAYTISSSLPGDYQVVSVSDKYCRYPPLKGRKG